MFDTGLFFKATGSNLRSLCSLVCKWNYRAGGEDKEGWDWSFLAQIGLADLTEHHLGSKAVAPGSPVADGLSERAALELGLNCGTRVGMRMIIVINISFFPNYYDHQP